MKIKLNESENSIEIKDGQKNQYLILKILMILNLANAVIRIFGKQTTEYGFNEYSWIGLGIISLVVLFMFLFKIFTFSATLNVKSGLSTLNNISGLNLIISLTV